MNIQLIKELAIQLENSPTTISTESKRTDEYSAAMKVYTHNKERGNKTDYDCPICKNRGDYAEVSDSGEPIIKTCSCMKKRRNIENLRNSGMGGILGSKTFANFEQTEEWQKGITKDVQEYVKSIKVENSPWLCILGQSGIGKTHLCCAATNELIEMGAPVIYMTWNNAVKELKRNATDDAVYSKLFDRYKDAEVLYIDDLFKGKVTETDVTIAFELINYRYNNSDYITIISSELSAKDLLNIDEAVAGRIMERAGKNLIQIKPEKKKNYRLKMLQEF